MACWLSGEPVKATPDNQHAIFEFPHRELAEADWPAEKGESEELKFMT